MPVELEPTPEKILDEEFWTHFRPTIDSRLSPDQCQPGYLYWGVGRAIGELAICEYGHSGIVQFKGLRNNMGADFLDEEIHYDCDPTFGTWWPVLQLEAAPESDDETVIMDWLLDKYLETTQLRIDWLEAMPNRLKRAASYGWFLEHTREVLAEWRRLKTEGFSKEETLNFRKIMSAKKSGK